VNAAPREISVEVAYALPERQVVVSLSVPAGTTLEQAIQRSALLDRHPEIDLNVNKVGVFGKLLRLDTLLRDGDRVEIYRPLATDPKLLRRQRAAQNKH
jgi:uncharacterized protein